MALIKDEMTGTTSITPVNYNSGIAGVRKGAIGHYASRIVASFVVAGHIVTLDDAIDAFNKVSKGINDTDIEG